MNQSYLISLAFYLAFLSYYLGTLILASPIPIYAFKKWGSILIKDSIFVFILIMGLEPITSFIETIASTIGSSWEAFYSWNDEVLSFLEMQRLIIITYYMALKAVNALILYSDILGPILRIVSYNIFTLYTYRFVGYFFQTFWTALVVLGIALISIPFRIGRSAGAWLIALAIVFYTGMPLMPSFSQLITPPLEPVTRNDNALESLGISFPTVNITIPEGSSSPPSALLEVCVSNNTSQKEMVARYISERNIVHTNSPEKGLPGKSQYYLYLIIDGLSFPVKPYPVDPAIDYKTVKGQLSLIIETPFIIWVREDYTLIYRNTIEVHVDNFSVIQTGNEAVMFNLSFSGEGYVELRAPDKTEYQILYNDCGLKEGSWEWLELSGKYARFESPNSSSCHFSIIIEGKSSKNPDLNGLEYSYVKDYLGVNTKSIYYILSMVFFKSVIAPMIYIILLTLIARQLANLLGSRVFPSIPLR